MSKVDDCNDLLRSIHPGRSEVGYNGVDDNCNGKTDEPTFEYFATGNLNTSTSFRMSVFLNHSEVLNAGLNNTLYAQVKYAKLSNSANSITLPKAQVLSYGGAFNALLSLWNLDPSAVYRAYVTFYRKTSTGYDQLGSSSDWYYTMTDGAAGKPHTRALMVLKGLKEFSESASEKVGYRGTVAVDGTRYAASQNELWCSEFYAWVTQPWMPGTREGRSA